MRVWHSHMKYIPCVLICILIKISISSNTCSVNSNTNQDYSVCCITSCLYVLKSKARQTAASWYGHHQTHAQNHLTRAMPGNHEQLLFVSNLSRTSKQPMSFLTVFLRIPCHFDSQSPKYKKKKNEKRYQELSRLCEIAGDFFVQEMRMYLWSIRNSMYLMKDLTLRRPFRQERICNISRTHLTKTLKRTTTNK